MTIDPEQLESLLTASGPADTIYSNNCVDGLLLWIPMRLGVDQLNPSYASCIRDLLQLPQSLGIAG